MLLLLILAVATFKDDLSCELLDVLILKREWIRTKEPRPPFTVGVVYA